MSLPDFLPTTDNELETRVRKLTQYENSPDQLTDAELSELVDEAKSDVYSTTGSQDWYVDEGLNKALRYGCAIICKQSVENEMVVSWSSSDETVQTANNVPREQSSQLQDWHDKVQEGLSESDVDTASASFSLSSEFYF